LAASSLQTSRDVKLSAIFQTVSPGTSVNREGVPVNRCSETMPEDSRRVRRGSMDEPVPGANVPEDWIGHTVLVLAYATGEALLPEGGFSLVGDIYSGELRAVNGYGVSLEVGSQEKEEGSYYPGGNTFFSWNTVLRITLASQ
jgi:hypothetical protein